ncbi:dihydroorotase [Candidatus Nitrosacidococcus tergens]|uniref:dihydroorotase n=1 Tax=Candidatus Nitrosacidococcus tergens TaxID=553981 RepID=UPI0018D92531|nr:dihydroorotase [Candidatus Nitrosacidococcus tergens]
MNRLIITHPDDWHLHLRDGSVLVHTVFDASQRFARAIVMPNLKPPIITTQQALAYRNRILSVLPKDKIFQPLMTLYLTDNTTAKEIISAKDSGYIYGVKLYPAGVTTNADSGVTSLTKLYPIFEVLQKKKLPLLLHGETIDPSIDIFDREKVFIEQNLIPILHDFPELKVVLEHISTQEAVEFIKAMPSNIAATITPHHLLLNRNAMLLGGIQPHHYCLPVLKKEKHRQALIAAATSGSPKFFLGTDSAPHSKSNKESACGCAGIYNSHAALELYAEIFEAADSLSKLEGFTSFYGPDFYGLPRNQAKITLLRSPWKVPKNLPFGDQVLIPLQAGLTINWCLEKKQ